MSSETSSQLLRMSSQFHKAQGSTPVCLVLPGSTAGMFPGTILQEFILVFPVVAQFRFKCLNDISIFFTKLEVHQNFQGFSTRRHLIPHTRACIDHICFQCVQCCSEISWHTVCKRQPWHARSGGRVWWQGRASGPYTPAQWATLARAGPDRQYPAPEEINV